MIATALLTAIVDNVATTTNVSSDYNIVSGDNVVIGYKLKAPCRHQNSGNGIHCRSSMVKMVSTVDRRW